MVRSKQSLQFNTCIITYPSNYDNLLTIELIEKKFKEIIRNNSTKVVIAREDPDEEINRIHYHIYYDDEVKRLQCSTKYFDIPLPEPVVVFVKQDKTRTYQLLADLASKLGGDNEHDMVPLLDQYVKDEMEEGTTYDILSVAHPNIQLKKDYYGDKYIMLRYVNKQKLLSELGDKFQVERIDEELKYLEENKEKLDLKIVDLTIDFAFKQENVATTDELIRLLRKYKMKLLRKMEKENRKKGKSTGVPVKKYAKNLLKIDKEIAEFRMFLREKILEKRLTKQELTEEITKDQKWWPIFCGSYLNYSKLITDMFRGKPPAKPTKHYEFKFWVPNKLYDYLVWLDQWVENWFTGKPLEHRPKGLCIIGPSRTGKTTLISCMGTFSYFKNVWNMDCWEGKAAFNVMDDMDAGDEGKGLSFCWYKPFFGAQDAITITDKFKPKQDIYNGKPLIWLNNYRLEDTFQSKTAWDYIEKNMVIVHISKPFTEPPTGMDIYEYKEFDPKTTWYYKNVYLKEKEEEEELEPLSERKRKLNSTNQNHPSDKSNDQDLGRPVKRITIEN